MQIISGNASPLWYRLIGHLAELTCMLLSLNTSFNENEPVVCRPEEALACFLRTEMDLLVLGSWVLARARP